jgi:hypothetical protein
MVTVLKGSMSLIYYSIGGTPYTSIGYTESLSIDFGRNVDPFYEHGGVQPVDIVEGNEEITGSITRAWIDWKLLDAILRGSGNDYLLPEMVLYVMHRIDHTTFQYLYLTGVKIGDASLDVPQEDFLMQDVDFRATGWTKAAL